MLWSGFSRETLHSIIHHCLSGDESPKTAHITRLYMYKHLHNILAHENSQKKCCLSVSGSSHLARLMGLTDVAMTAAGFPQHDLRNLQFETASFDFLVSDQVIEHIPGNPFEPAKEATRVVKMGGYVVHTTCFINEVHGAPSDFWRFTPDCLRQIVEASGCNVIDCGGWGNREAWPYMDLGFRMHPIPDNPSNPIYKLAMKNDKAVPIVTWVVGQRTS